MGPEEQGMCSQIYGWRLYTWYYHSSISKQPVFSLWVSKFQCCDTTCIFYSTICVVSRSSGNQQKPIETTFCIVQCIWIIIVTLNSLYWLSELVDWLVYTEKWSNTSILALISSCSVIVLQFNSHMYTFISVQTQELWTCMNERPVCPSLNLDLLKLWWI